MKGEDNFMKKYKQLVKEVQIMVLSMAMVVMGVGEFWIRRSKQYEEKNKIFVDNDNNNDIRWYRL